MIPAPTTATSGPLQNVERHYKPIRYHLDSSDAPRVFVGALAAASTLSQMLGTRRIPALSHARLPLPCCRQSVRIAPDGQLTQNRTAPSRYRTSTISSTVPNIPSPPPAPHRE